MHREEYDLYECLPDRSLSWRGVVRGLWSAHARLSQLANDARNECFAMESSGSDIVLARAPLHGAKRIFQVAYGKALAVRGHLLCLDGYDVTSAAGNEIAQQMLSAFCVYDLFLIGHAGSDPVRTQMARWLRARFPHTRIVALNAPDHLIDGLQYNAPSEPTAAWLPTVSAAVKPHP